MDSTGDTATSAPRTRRIGLSDFEDLLRPVVAGAPTAPEPRKLLAYLHVPFCNSKCIFCDWVTPIAPRQLRGTAPIRETYARALAAQIRSVGPLLREGYELTNIYWGGGTPTKLEPADFRLIVEALSESLDLSTVVEHTFEASPETLTPEKLQTLHALGANRISIGAQSMDDRELKDIGRAHSSAQTASALQMARAAGFRNINIDIIVGFPGQHLDTVVRTMTATLALEPEHVTVYPYRPSPGTVMSEQINKGSRRRGSLKEALDCYNAATLMLRDAGYEEYSLGYFARGAANVCRAELYYFGLQGDYIGFGSGARSILAHHMLESSPTDLHGFMAQPAAFDVCERYSPEKLHNILPALRLALFDTGGINFHRFKQTFGFEFAELLRDPLVNGLLDYLRLCGTEFRQTEEALFATPETRARGYIMSLLRAFVPLKNNQGKVEDAFAYVEEHEAAGAGPG